jgi:hypothetical protein
MLPMNTVSIEVLCSLFPKANLYELHGPSPYENSLYNDFLLT